MNTQSQSSENILKCDGGFVGAVATVPSATLVASSARLLRPLFALGRRSLMVGPWLVMLLYVDRTFCMFPASLVDLVFSDGCFFVPTGTSIPIHLCYLDKKTVVTKHMTTNVPITASYRALNVAWCMAF